MSISARDVLKRSGVITLSQCSFQRLVAHMGAPSVGKALAKLDASPRLPLEPNLGGRRVQMDDLQPGDVIIVSGKPPSPIKAGGRISISYAILYLGPDEAVGAPIEVIDPASVVCVMRPKEQPNITELRNAIHTGDRTQWGRVYQAVFRLDDATWCIGLPGAPAKAPSACRTWLGHVNLGSEPATEDEDPNKGFFSFYLPKFIIDAYQTLGKPIAHQTIWRASASKGDPEVDLEPDQVTIRLTGALGYVGHLKWPN
jgi:hypothetical protein